MVPRVQCHEMKANPKGYLWSKYECFLTTGCQGLKIQTSRKLLTKYNRGDYNSSFALCAVELKSSSYVNKILKFATDSSQ